MGSFGAKKFSRNLINWFGTINREVRTNNIIPRNIGQLRFRRLAFFDDVLKRRCGSIKEMFARQKMAPDMGADLHGKPLL
ncbi:hypothetical protein EDC32_101101 [Laceyella sacchari]|nr:hypothetical protein EDC32_101101 [Laceyella sacchari]